eukprot:CAMPEP_0175142872 /NCGR_PEP_ID=MMETSP0087-20121206/13078_1 /TAXON_ID=136419 /ORGANISM="Unknown Unknown, Strain D1" /LENGTH=271 /DNA_ID=CAMNT_0016426799 /DNA_START=27 /DNA_END=842 /DNA_ORIENTATION=-
MDNKPEFLKKVSYKEKGAGQVSAVQGFRPPCPVCELPISSGSVTCEGQEYHPACFKCKKCDSKLRDETWRKLDGGYYCNECIDTNGTLYQQWKQTDDAKRFATKPTEVKVSADFTVDTGCYLTFDTASGGTLFINWKTSPVEGALAYFKPKKNVPGFKFKTNGGKSELTRGTETSNMQNYWTGVCNFIKLAKDLDAAVILFKDDVFAIWAHIAGNKIERWQKDKWYDIAAMDTLNISVVSHQNAAFQGVSTLGKDSFLSNGQGAGAAVALK